MNNSAQGQPGTGWQLEGQQETSEVSPANQIVQGYRIQFVTQYGAHGSVFLPREAYTADRVRQAIVAQATTMDTVHTLSG